MLITNLHEINLKNGRTVLKNINFTLKPNTIYTIIGKNGSGKTTLIKSITGLLNDNFYSVIGEVNYNDRDLFSLEYKQLLKVRNDKIKYVFQDVVNSFDQLKKLKYYFKKFVNDKNKLDELLKYFLLPSYKELKKKYPYELSGGMAQRLSLSIALSTNPSLLILDEPTSGIDVAIANLILLKLKEFKSENENIVLLVTQDLKFAEKISDKIALLSGGMLSEFFNVDQFFNQEIDFKKSNLVKSYKEVSE